MQEICISGNVNMSPHYFQSAANSTQKKEIQVEKELY